MNPAPNHTTETRLKLRPFQFWRKILTSLLFLLWEIAARLNCSEITEIHHFIVLEVGIQKGSPWAQNQGVSRPAFLCWPGGNPSLCFSACMSFLYSLQTWPCHLILVLDSFGSPPDVKCPYQYVEHAQIKRTSLITAPLCFELPHLRETSGRSPR